MTLHKLIDVIEKAWAVSEDTTNRSLLYNLLLALRASEDAKFCIQ